MPKCNSCNAEILWTTSPLGKKLPLDAKALQGHEDPRLTNRSILYAVEGPADEPRAVKRERWEAGYNNGEPVYLSHFATCPNAASHSRGRK